MNTEAPKMTEIQIERAQVEQVFRLGGGELNDHTDAWEGNRHWYEGQPSYLPADHGREYRTVVTCLLWGSPSIDGWE